MTIEQCEKRNKAIMENALLWVKGEVCEPLYDLDVAVVAEYLEMNLPKCFYNFVESEMPNTPKALGGLSNVTRKIIRSGGYL